MSHEKPAGHEFMSREWYQQQASNCWFSGDPEIQSNLISFCLLSELSGIRRELFLLSAGLGSYIEGVEEAIKESNA